MTAIVTPMLRGVIPALLTPMKRDTAALDLPALKLYLDQLIHDGIDGLLVGGTTGEVPVLTLAERLHLAEEVVKQVAGRIPVAVHVGSFSTAEAVTLAAHAREIGADAVAAVTPSYFSYDEAELAAYFRALAQAAAPLPCYLYNLPRHTRNPLTVPLVRLLRATEPNIVGIKESSGEVDTLESFLQTADEGFKLLCGADHLILSALQGGAVGCVASGAATHPRLYRLLLDTWHQGDLDTAREVQRVIVEFQRVLGQGIPIARYKAFWTLKGIPLGAVRPPHREMMSGELVEMKRGLALISSPIARVHDVFHHGLALG